MPAGVADARTPLSTQARVGASVTVANMAFSPAVVTVGLGGTVTWSFQDSVSHTTTSDQGFWDSGARPGGATYAHAFTSSGTFAYHCSIHSMMHGKVRVPVSTTGSPSAGWRLRWSTRKGSGRTTFVVQTRLGKGRWKPLVSGARAHKRFDPSTAGRYSVRARTQRGGHRSGWSPTVTVTIS